MNLIKFMLGILGSVIISSCGTIYQNPPKNPQHTATLRSKATRSGVMTWADYAVEVVDDKAVNYTLSLTKESKEIVVSSGNHNIVLAGSFNQAFGGGGPFVARGDLNMNFKPGMDYQANGRVQGSKLLLWIEDAKTKKPASEVLQLSYQRQPRGSSTLIFVPASY